LLTRTDIAQAKVPRLDSGFREILDKVLDGGELSVNEGERLLQAEGEELRVLIRVADGVRRRRVGDTVTYVVNRNINHTNICMGSCKFCAFRRSPDDPDAYVLTRGQITTKVREVVKFGATEVCIQGGLHPEFGLEEYIWILRAVRNVSPSIHIHAFSPAELDHIAGQEWLSIEDVIKTLREAGLNSVPGTAAEILVDRVRSVICPKKISPPRWIEIIKACHRLNLPTTATMLYGTVETPHEQAEHLALLRDIQHQTGGFTEFIPLAFMPYNTPLGSGGERSPPGIVESLRVHAVARLMLTGYIDNIQTSWVKLGSRGAQLMLCAGANDLSGTLFEENITRAAGGERQAMTPNQLKALIIQLRRTPRQRTTTYEFV
jgi:7,8-didemethyl-8-hydroxy-5-deazariboflavin synthase CofH subunit